jgi:hypothetical protein
MQRECQHSTADAATSLLRWFVVILCTMRRNAWCLAGIPLAIMCCSCGPSSPRGAPAPVLGTFEFRETVPETSPGVMLEGEFTVDGDTIMMETTGGLCRYDHQNSQALSIVYRCGDVRFNFDRRDPLNRTTYSLTTTVSVPVRTCARYETRSNGQRFCAETRTELQDRRVQRSGRLRPKRIG